MKTLDGSQNEPYRILTLFGA